MFPGFPPDQRTSTRVGVICTLASVLFRTEKQSSKEIKKTKHVRKQKCDVIILQTFPFEPAIYTAAERTCAKF